MRFIRFQTLAFTPTQSEYRNNPTFYCDEFIKFYNAVTFLNTDKIVSVSTSDHPEIEVCADRKVVATIRENTTAIRMEDGKTYHVDSEIDVVITDIRIAARN